MMHRQSMEHEPAARSHVRLARSRRLVGVAAAAILVLIAVDEPTQAVSTRQRVAIEITMPLDGPTGSFVLRGLTPGSPTSDVGSATFTSGPTPVFIARVINGQSVDRFRAIDTLEGSQGTLVISLQVDFVSAGGGGYLVGTGRWSIIDGTGIYASWRGGGGSALVSPPSPPGQHGYSNHEGFVTVRPR